MGTTKLSEADSIVAESLALILLNEGQANIRTGSRRSVAKARKIAKAAASLIDHEVKTSDQDGYLFVVVK